MTAESAGVEMFGTLVGDMQEDVVIVEPTETQNGEISGKFYEQTSGALAEHWGNGYFFCPKFTSTMWDAFDSVEVGLSPSQGSGLVDIKNDPDKNGAFKVTSPSVQNFVIQATKGSKTITKTYEFTAQAVGYHDDGQGGTEIDTLWV